MKKENPRRRLKAHKEQTEHTMFVLGLYSGDSSLALMGMHSFSGHCVVF